ncbi:hypothetical protein JM49_10730 [Pseudomonas chlororaphis subsp. aurantiaca]|nr:hypothetical protein JM49_10730 [Pseudomonas chlororaphis subsp. aurantiaca]
MIIASHAGSKYGLFSSIFSSVYRNSTVSRLILLLNIRGVSISKCVMNDPDAMLINHLLLAEIVDHPNSSLMILTPQAQGNGMLA